MKLHTGHRTGALALAVLLVAGTLAATSTLALAQRQFVTLASGWVVGVYYPLAGAMSRIVYNANIGIRLTVESSGASAANAGLIVFNDLNTFYSAHAAARQATLQNARDGIPVPLHPGAERFYKEAGVL